MKHLIHIAFACALFVLGVMPADARGVRGEGALDAGEPRVAGELLVDAGAVQPGEEVRVGVLFTMDPGWHIYWRNPGDSGAVTQIAWNSPGAAFGELAWPAPKVFREADVLTTFGYKGEVLLATTATVPATASGTWHIEVDADFVVCEIQCIPGELELARDVPVGTATTEAVPEVRAKFEHAASRLPKSAQALGITARVVASQDALPSGDEGQLALELRSCAAADQGCSPWVLNAKRAHDAFIPEASKDLAFEPLGVGASTDAGIFSLVISARAWSDLSLGSERLRGLVPLVSENGVAHVALDVPIELADEAALATAFEVVDALAPPPAPAEVAPASAPLSLGVAILLALLGGLILNLMPCVLPVLALKVFGIAEIAHEERGRIVQHGLAYLAGVMLSMGVLAGVVVGLRTAGTAVGWGFQFQEPVFLAAICTLLVVFAMNLFGAFEITWQPAGPGATGEAEAHSPRRSFFEGTLAVVLATPCTAPFLGTAVGFAFAGSGAVIFAIFGAIGLGLSAPYVLVTLVPGWARFVPKPGAWMLRVRAALGFSLLAATVWLLWVMGRAAGIDAQALLLAFLVVVAFGMWILGTLQASGKAGAARATLLVLAGAIVIGLALLPLRPAPGPRAVTASNGIAWQAWDPAEIARERVAGRPVFVDFTADWCITCQVNESVVLADEAVLSELARHDYATFKADWTLRDEAIGAALQAQGRAGVPMVLVYPADPSSAPTLLPELLTVGGTVEALRDAAGG